MAYDASLPVLSGNDRAISLALCQRRTLDLWSGRYSGYLYPRPDLETYG